MYERELEKYAVRRNPLGMDRHHRCYWSVPYSIMAVIRVQYSDADDSINMRSNIESTTTTVVETTTLASQGMDTHHRCD